ncbi:hypothetical protein D0Z00_002645 [Geotrichum galactomycetum]|uniref:Uncharacterized protein n=1 Tax=Geotrichum galactomycetum TaxID=27317 RepID=A0ACB6V3K2_9ASCO|nr:hypothetical protein D0Z00_002645 [Geotrichum candidum]
MGEEKPPPGIVLSSDPPQEEQQQPHQQQPISAPNSPSYFSHSVNPSPPFFTAVPGPTHSHGSGTEHDGGQRNSSAGVNNIYTNNNTFSIPSIIAMNGNSGSTPFQASGGLHNNSLSGAANPISTSMSMISPSRNFSNVMQHHKFRSPSLPVNSLGTPIEMPQLASISVAEAQSLLQKEPELTLFVDIRPFALYSKSRVQSAVNVCIPTTLLKRPTFVLARFAECMIPAQRDAIENLDRYDNYDKSLSGGGDYFNASYITTKGTKMRYIATQGPLPDTFTDFWHVVWAKRIPVIVMLTAEAEGGSVKCHRYWNNGVYGGIALRLVAADNVVLSERTGTCVTIRTFELAPVSTKGDAAMKVDEGSSNGARHTVVQVQYTAWPDLGSPANPEDLIALCMLKNKYLESWVQETPASADDGLLPWTIVHCSAGCGRTGTFCTVDSVISLLKDQAKNNPTETPFHNAAASTATATAPVTPTAGIEGRGENGEVAATAKGGGSTTTTIGHENVESHDLIYRTVHNFRRQRLSMVQVLRQYVLCYETVILWIHNQCGPTKHNQLLPQQQQLQGLLPQFQDEHSNKKKNK